jgi:hypothetical protein
MKPDRLALLLGALFLAVALAGPWMPPWALFILTIGFAKGLVALGLMLFLRAGLVSFGHALYYCAGAYAAGGLTVNPTGLEFEAITARAAPNDPGKVLVSGALRNVREDERIAPPVRVALLDQQGAEIGHAVVRIDAAPVLPGKVQGFAATIADPGGKGQGVGVAFMLEDAAPPPAPRVAPAVQRPLPAADVGGLRPALPPGPLEALNMQPIDAVPLAASPAIDSQGPEAVSASHG